MRYAISLLISSIYTAVAYHGLSEDNAEETFLNFQSHPWKISEDKAFRESGVCVAENRPFVQLCETAETVTNITYLKLTNCFCDADCYKYNDCCMNVGSKGISSESPWKCREVGQNLSKTPLYVYQMCPDDWTDDNIRTLCEVEASVLEKQKKKFSYIQDIPVKSITSGTFYRNVYCATCNGVSDLVTWNITLFCSKVFDENNEEITDKKFDFSQSIYDTRAKRFIKVFNAGRQVSCKIYVDDFKLPNFLKQHNIRFCKQVINTCSTNTDKDLLRKCNSYVSYVYERVAVRSLGKVYNNFHCALCNGVSADNLTCVDPRNWNLLTDHQERATLKFLFDFNFFGGNNQIGVASPCKLSDGLIWDPIMQKCMNFTCGSLFERKGMKCIPRESKQGNGGLNNTCLKRILPKESFVMFRNRNVLIKETSTLITADEYEVNERDRYEIISINICAEEGTYLLNLLHIQYFFDEVILSLSIVCLILHLTVYAILKELRNCPGKILICLSSCILCGHVFLLVGQYIKIYWLCYLCSVLTYFGYLSSFFWMHIMSYDIYRTFSAIHKRNSNDKWKFLKYGVYCWMTAIVVILFSVLFDLFMDTDSEYRPSYANPICWFNQKKGLLLYFVVPVSVLLANNITFFFITAFRIRKLSKETKMVKNLSDIDRYLLYVKLTVVLGLTWSLGILAGIFQTSVLWHIFIFFNGMQGVFIFISFTMKRKILKKLGVKLGIHSSKYKMGKQSAIRRAIYSSLSNLSTLHTTLSSQLPIYDENQDILKAVKKLNPE